MPAVRLSNLSRRDADDYRDAVVAREPALLAELSGWIQAEGGPWGELDASIRSLDPLWSWFLRFAASGCPGIPLGGSTLEWVAGEADDSPALGRTWYVVEAIGHYVMLVCRRVDPDATWTVDRHQNSDTFQETGIQLSNDTILPVFSLLTAMARPLIHPESHDGGRDNDRSAPTGAGLQANTLLAGNDLAAVITQLLGSLAPLGQARQAPALPAPRWAETAAPDLPPDAPAGFVPADGAARVVRPRTSDDDLLADMLVFGDDLFILRGPAAGLANPILLDPLDGELIDSHLREHGLTPTESQDDGRQHTQFWHLDQEEVYATAAVTSLDGLPRSISAGFEGDLDCRAQSFRSAATTFITLARRLDARLTNSDEIDAELERELPFERDGD